MMCTSYCNRSEVLSDFLVGPNIFGSTSCVALAAPLSLRSPVFRRPPPWHSYIVSISFLINWYRQKIKKYLPIVWIGCGSACTKQWTLTIRVNMSPLLAFKTFNIFDGNSKWLIGDTFCHAFQVFFTGRIFLPLELVLWLFLAKWIIGFALNFALKKYLKNPFYYN